ncbi:hypothetical protein M514_01642 [Trichuris suis]|uniref:Uncharacterized protein n=1 Tax=Trichuris suis TaxID=68888 RepID=A0A085N278_9BILA|nr:hypothetical protein M513_01642 [Trichuris suis]KFD63574.1 hypothetical protein M514_01642 [Trichuris suis]
MAKEDDDKEDEDDPMAMERRLDGSGAGCQREDSQVYLCRCLAGMEFAWTLIESCSMDTTGARLGEMPRQIG